MKNTQKHILVIRLSAMGDVAMTVPVLRALIQQNENIKITVLTKEFFKPIFNHIPNVEIISPGLKNKHKGFLGLRKLAKELYKLNIDEVADIHNVLRSNIIVRFLKLKGIPFKQINKGRKEKKALVRDQNKVFKQLKSTHERYADVFRELGHQIDLSKVILDKLPFPEQLARFKEKKRIGFAPFAAHGGKKLPLNKTKELLSKLSKELEVEVFIFGSKTEKDQLLEFVSDFNNIHLTSNKNTFNEELQIISNLDTMISMDSGNGHLAAMFGVNVITIWGVTHPYAGFVPFNQPLENQLIPDLEKYPLIPTSIYGNKYPDGYLNCFDTIKTETVIIKLKELLN